MTTNTAETLPADGMAPDLSDLSSAQLADYLDTSERSAADAGELLAGLAELPAAEREEAGVVARARAAIGRRRAEAARREQERRNQASRDRLARVTASIVDRPADSPKVLEAIEQVAAAVATLRAVAAERKQFAKRTSAALLSVGIQPGPRGSAGLWHTRPGFGDAVGAGRRMVEPLDPDLLFALAVRRAYGGSLPSGAWQVPQPSSALVAAPDAERLAELLARELGEE
ncbi:hypothetical protein [Pseudofrankia inefficax]|uniref:Uncharacterized protein n=1 Tax=Pseudofrankia inefficax (strain DSM 45817 / CECT 9037 / DDB 130130 / EuI1c) TaxID=298654 RepID=E3J654_PSEI1|nr:hypothetical protein [Pseudofrankia inefficax]ADP78345.1 hypothetical protein FraEuI1c_0259 [Pseudofrankia inefficax]